MSILNECPSCKKKQGPRNKICSCGENLDKAKRSGRVRYWIKYRLPGGKQRKEFVGNSIAEARDADGKRRGQKRDNDIFDMLPESKTTFNELAEWYLGLPKTKQLSDCYGMKIRLNNFNSMHGEKLVKDIKQIDIENYQIKRQTDGVKNTTIDLEFSIVKAMIFKAFDNDMISGKTLKAFRKTKKISSMAERVRIRVLSIQEYSLLVENAAQHLKPILITAYNTGMRPGEIRQLQWDFIDRKAGFIRLPAEFTKEKRSKVIPINHHVEKVLKSVPRHLNHEFVFTYQGKPLKKQHGGSADAIKTACRRSKIPYGKKTDNGIIFHDFRRTFKTNMLKAGVDKVYRDTIVGHSLRGMDAHYIHPSENDLRRAMDKFTNWLDLHSASGPQSGTKNGLNT